MTPPEWFSVYVVGMLALCAAMLITGLAADYACASECRGYGWDDGERSGTHCTCTRQVQDPRPDGWWRKP